MTLLHETAPSHPAARLARRAPIAVFLGGTFLWAWALWGYWVPAMPAGGIVVTPAFIITAIMGGLAPSLAALFTSGLMQGWKGVGYLLRGLTRWRVSLLDYGLAIGIVPGTTVVAAVLLPIVTGLPLRTADPSIIAMALIWPVMAALGEELGWRGFLFPRLSRDHGLVRAALIVGIIWGVWHLPADFVGLKAYGGLFWLAFIINGPYVLTAHALVMAWLWRKTDGNLVMMMLYHWSITATAMVAPTVGGQDGAGLVAAAITATALWVVAVFLWTARRQQQ